MDGPPPPPPASVFTLKKPLKITKVVRPVVVAAPAPEEISPEEEERRFGETFGATRSSIRKLGATCDFVQVLELVAARPDATCVAFDFDQTLHLREHIRGRSLELLERLHALHVPFCIVTAAQARSSSVRALAQELHELHMDAFFRTTKLEKANALEVIRRDWPQNETLSDSELQSKLLMLLSLFTDRRPSDLSRVGYSGISFKENDTAVYRMQRGPADWSAELVLASDADPRVCPVRCLRAHLERIGRVRSMPVYREIDPELDMPDDILPGDRLFLTETGKPLEPTDTEKLVGDFLIRTCNYPDWQARKKESSFFFFFQPSFVTVC